jgi:hypothetical protein
MFESISDLNFEIGTILIEGDFLPPGRAMGMRFPQGTLIARNPWSQLF